jgi:hypothetical protein
MLERLCARRRLQAERRPRCQRAHGPPCLRRRRPGLDEAMSGVHDLRGEAGNRQRIPDTSPRSRPKPSTTPSTASACSPMRPLVHAGAFTRDDLQALLDEVACAFFDQTTAPWLSRFVITVSTFDCVLTTILGRVSSLARIAPAVAQDLRRHGRRPTVDKATRDRGPRLVTVGVNAGSTSVCQGARVHPRRFRSTIWLGQPSRGAASPGASTSNPRVGGSNPPRRVVRLTTLTLRAHPKACEGSGGRRERVSLQSPLRGRRRPARNTASPSAPTAAGRRRPFSSAAATWRSSARREPRSHRGRSRRPCTPRFPTRRRARG